MTKKESKFHITYQQNTGMKYASLRISWRKHQSLTDIQAMMFWKELKNCNPSPLEAQEMGKSSGCEKHCKEAKRDILNELLGKTSNGGFAPYMGFGSMSGGMANSAVRQWAENKLKEL